MAIIRALGAQTQEADFDGTGFTAEIDITAVLRSSINNSLPTSRPLCFHGNIINANGI
jgi:hypothetical protein